MAQIIPNIFDWNQSTLTPKSFVHSNTVFFVVSALIYVRDTLFQLQNVKQLIDAEICFVIFACS